MWRWWGGGIKGGGGGLWLMVYWSKELKNRFQLRFKSVFGHSGRGNGLIVGSYLLWNFHVDKYLSGCTLISMLQKFFEQSEGFVAFALWHVAQFKSKISFVLQQDANMIKFLNCSWSFHEWAIPAIVVQNKEPEHAKRVRVGVLIALPCKTNYLKEAWSFPLSLWWYHVNWIKITVI